MTIEETAVDGVTVFRLVGELDMKDAPVVQSRLAAPAEGQGPRAIVNLERLDYIDSAGLGALVAAAKAYASRRGKLVLVAPTAPVRHVLDITRLATFFEILASEAEAVAALGR
jgi:anti-sigma B factor antagonist